MNPSWVRRTVRLSFAAGALALAAAACGQDATPPGSEAAPANAGVNPAGASTTATPPPSPGSSAGRPQPNPRAAAATPTITAAAPKPADLYFGTPEQAMRYLTAAYNSGDQTALKKVTNASARTALLDMRQEAVNLRLDNCARRPQGDYTCYFDHDYPAGLHRAGHGHATFLAAPATRRGWYMTVLISCG